jgi:hypothetical protein
MSTPPAQPENAPPRTQPVEPSPAPTFDEADFKRRLMDEYKILQEKIDKIGGFRFTIKGWSITAVIAATAAGSTYSKLLTAAMISISLAFMLGFFCRFEFQQVKLSRLFGERARKLENGFRQLDLGIARSSSELIAVPYTAHEIVLASLEQRLRAQRKEPGPKHTWAGRWRVLKQADIYFYGALISLALILPLVPRHREIHAHLKDLMHECESFEHASPRPGS